MNLVWYWAFVWGVLVMAAAADPEIVSLTPNGHPIRAILKGPDGKVLQDTGPNGNGVTPSPPPTIPLGIAFIQKDQIVSGEHAKVPFSSLHAPPPPAPPLGPPTDGCTGLLASVPGSCPDFTTMISELGSDLNPSQKTIQAVAIKYKPSENCCSAWRGFYASHDGKLGCGCSNSILSQSSAFGVTQAAFEQVYKAVYTSCAYLGGSYASGFYNNKCPKIAGYN